MINNPNMLEETLENINKVPEEVIKKSIKEVIMNDEEAIEELEGYAQNHSNFDEEVREAIDVVLELVEKQKAEIERLTSLLETEDILLKNEAELSEELKVEIEKKDNIIDEMSNYIIIHHQVKTMKKTFCKNCTECKGIVRDCIIEYFENKVKDYIDLKVTDTKGKERTIKFPLKEENMLQEGDYIGEDGICRKESK